MTKWHAHVVHMAKHTNMVGGPFLVGDPGPGFLWPTPKFGAASTTPCNYDWMPASYTNGQPSCPSRHPTC